MLKTTLNKVRQCILPESCMICGATVQIKQPLCSACYNELPFIGDCCLQCSTSFQSKGVCSGNTVRFCGQCLKKPPPFDITLALFHYQEPINGLIRVLKFKNNLAVARLFGTLFIEKIGARIKEDKPDLIIPVPLHRTRLKQRGFNQALELSRPIAKQLGIKIADKSCIRYRNTAAQTVLVSKMRRNNLKDAFQIINPLNAKHIAIVDDVVTTGSTVAELSRSFKALGTKKIQIWCCAKTDFLSANT